MQAYTYLLIYLLTHLLTYITCSWSRDSASPELHSASQLTEEIVKSFNSLEWTLLVAGQHELDIRPVQQWQHVIHSLRGLTVDHILFT